VPRSGSTYYAPRTRDAGCRASSQAVLQVRGDALCVQGAGWLSVAHDDHDVDRLCHECRLGVPQMKGDCATNVSWRYPAARSRRLKAVPVRLFSASRWVRIQLLEQHSLSKCQVTPAHANRDSAGLSGTCSPIRAGVCVKQLYLVVVCKHRDGGIRAKKAKRAPLPYTGVCRKSNKFRAQLPYRFYHAKSTSASSIHRSARQPRPLQPGLGTRRVEGCTLGGCSRWKIRASAV
jgi:hypothetical protein